MKTERVAELLDGLPVSSSIAVEVFREVESRYADVIRSERETESTFERRRIEAFLTARWRLPGERVTILGGWLWKESPLPIRHRDWWLVQNDLPGNDWSYEEEPFDPKECEIAGLSLATNDIEELRKGRWLVRAWIPRELWDENRPKVRELLPLPDRRLDEWEWMVVFWAMAKFLESKSEKQPETERHPSTEANDQDESKLDPAEFTGRPIGQLISKFGSFETPNGHVVEEFLGDEKRFDQGREIVVKALLRECLARSTQRARDKSTFSLIVFNGSERPAFLPTGWESGYWPSEDNLESAREWFIVTREILEQLRASNSDENDVVSHGIARQASEDAWRLARHHRDRHGIAADAKRPTGESLSAAKRFLDDLTQATSIPATNDDAYCLASELWQERSGKFPQFKSYKQLRTYLNKIPESEIRRIQEARRFKIHLKDWKDHWKRIDEERFALLDHSLPALLKEAQARGGVRPKR